jgi:hypothetical protein
LLPAWGYEYRSKAQIVGWPLIHVAQGGLAIAPHGIGALGSDPELALWLEQPFPAARGTRDPERSRFFHNLSGALRAMPGQRPLHMLAH